MRKAKESGLTDEEAKPAFNQNTMSTGQLDEGPAGLGGNIVVHAGR